MKSRSSSFRSSSNPSHNHSPDISSHFSSHSSSSLLLPYSSDSETKRFSSSSSPSLRSSSSSFCKLKLSSDLKKHFFDYVNDIFLILLGIPLIILKYAEKLGLNTIFLLEKLILLLCTLYKKIMEGRKKKRELGGKRREMLTKLREEGRRGERSWKEDGEKRKDNNRRKQEEEEEENLRTEKARMKEGSEINKLDLVLDLDETLIYCSSRVRKEVGNVIKLEGKEYQILVRPKCEEFLEKMSKIYNIHVYTAGEENYAKEILKIINKKGFIKNTLTRSDCVFKKNTLSKDLSKINPDLDRIIMVDNTPSVVAGFPDNSLIIKTWMGEPNDSELEFFANILFELRNGVDLRRKIRRAKREIDFS